MRGWRGLRRGARRVAAAMALAFLGVAFPAAPALAAAQPVGDCTTTSGVIVVVDFAHWGGPVLRSCGTTPTTGYALLNQGGWQTAGTQHDGPGFICRIGYAGYQGGTQYPTPSQESCVLTPPASAYWAYWYANPGQNAWNYSQLGATEMVPEPGSVELWTFGGTSLGGTTGSAVPTITPASVRASNTRPSGSGGPAGSGGSAGKPAPAASRQAGAPARQSGRAGAPATRGHAAGATVRASTAPSERATVINAPPAAATSPAGHGSATPAIIALAIVLVLAAAGITAVLRRPRRDQ
jgi:hypothetical protein